MRPGYFNKNFFHLVAIFVFIIIVSLAFNSYMNGQYRDPANVSGGY